MRLKNGGKRIIPTIEFSDGSILVEPSNAELADKLGLKTTAERSHYDLIIGGGGPAGLTAALYTAREGIDTLIIERAALGGQAATTQWLDNVPGFADGIDGAPFSDQLRRQASRFGVEILQAQEAMSIHSPDSYHCVTTAGGSEYSARALLLATGSHYRRLGVPGEERYIGAGVHLEGYDKRAPHMLETSVPGIFAAGDTQAGSTKQVASAAGEGATAALLIREYLKTV